jgi:enoyl-CoA hydratase/carnithine racemase
MEGKTCLNVGRIGTVVVVTFDRPAIRNPLSVELLERLRGAIEDVTNDPTVRGMVFTGVGDVFASGADLREIAAVVPAEACEFARRGQSLMASIAALGVPTVAAVNGICFGGALDLALSCRRRIASPAAQFSHPGASLGIMTGWGGTQRLPRLVGEAAALEMFLTGKRVGAEEAFKIGLVDLIADDPLAAALGELAING